MFPEIASLVLAVLVINFLIQLPFLFVCTRIIESSPPFGVQLADPVEGDERFRIPTTGGLELAGCLLPPSSGQPRGLVVFCPETGGNQWMALNYCGSLLEAGFAVLSFDFRNQGASDSLPGYEPLHWMTRYEMDDLGSVLRYVESRADLAGLPVGLFGVSRGGATALAVSVNEPQIRWIVTESAFCTQMIQHWFARHWAKLFVPDWLLRLVPDWHVRWTVDLARGMTAWRRGLRYPVLRRLLPRLAGRPVLMISGKRDSYVKPDIARQMQQCAGEGCELWLVPKARHNDARTIDQDAYDRRVTGFVDVAMGTDVGAEPSVCPKSRATGQPQSVG